MRVLLPVRPDNDCSDPARILEALFGHDDVSVLRIFVYRPAELDAYNPEMFHAFTEIRRLDDDAVRAAVASTKMHCRKLLDYGFHVESAIVSGFPVDKVIAEARLWKADMIMVHVTHEKLREARIGHLVGALIDRSPLPVLLYSKLGETIGKKIRVLVENETARKWAARLASRQQGAIEEIREGELQRALAGDGCDLLIIPSRHHFAPAILGSPERRIIRQSEVPVLLIPTES
jgi:nucleotide-binding universal stress UspA family protein